MPFGVEVQGAEQARPARNGDEAHAVAAVRIGGRGQDAGSRGHRVFGNGSRSRGDGGEIVDAVNGDGQRGVSGGPVVVRDLIVMVSVRVAPRQAAARRPPRCSACRSMSVGGKGQGAVAARLRSQRHEAQDVMDVRVGGVRQDAVART